MCVLYSPPDSAPIVLQNLSLFLQQVNLSNFVLGDFNANCLDTSSSLYFLLHSILCSFDLTQVVREPTTLPTSGTATLIDLTRMSNPSSLEVCSLFHLSLTRITMVCRSLSNGKLQIGNLDPEKVGNIHKLIFKGPVSLLMPLTGILFCKVSTLIRCGNVGTNASCQSWNSVPRSTLPKGRKLPWVNGHIKHAICKRKSFWRKSQQNPAYKLKYKQLRNKVVSLLAR